MAPAAREPAAMETAEMVIAVEGGLAKTFSLPKDAPLPATAPAAVVTPPRGAVGGGVRTGMGG